MTGPHSAPEFVRSRPMARGARSVGPRRLPSATAWVGASLALLALALLSRAPVPIDETRYLSVAWEMWRDGSWLVPHLNGAPYADKPPLMFWSIGLAWSVFGVSEWVARCVPPLYGLGALALCANVARQLWPAGTAPDRQIDRQIDGQADRRAGIGATAAVVLAGTCYWAVFSGVVMFDLIVACFVLAALRAVLWAASGAGWRAWSLVGLALGAGLLAKGPAAFVPVLCVASCAPWWASRMPDAGWGRWYAGLALAVVVACAIGLAWALPAAWAGGPAYRQDLLIDQTAGRMSASFAHARPWWWYAPLLLPLLAPWSLWPGLWSRPGKRFPPPLGNGLRSGAVTGLGSGADRGLRFCTVWLLGPVAVFSMLSGKQPHYLLPAFPAFAILVARQLHRAERLRRADRWPAAVLAAFVATLLGAFALFGDDVDALGSLRGGVGPATAAWAALPLVGAAAFLGAPRRLLGSPFRLAAGATGLMVLTLGCASLALAPVLARNYDVGPLARRLGTLQAAGAPLASVGDPAGQFGLPGRLREPMAILGREDATGWAAEHPDGWLVVPVDDGAPVVPADALPYRSGYRRLVRASSMGVAESVARR